MNFIKNMDHTSSFSHVCMYVCIIFIMFQDYAVTKDLMFTEGNIWILERRGGAVDIHDYNTVGNSTYLHQSIT